MESKALQDATERASRWQHEGNVSAEKGKAERAEKCYEKSQYWRDRMNRLLGNGTVRDSRFRPTTPGQDPTVTRHGRSRRYTRKIRGKYFTMYQTGMFDRDEAARLRDVLLARKDYNDVQVIKLGAYRFAVYVF